MPQLETSAAIGQIAAALAATQAELESVPKERRAKIDGKSSYSYSYASLADALDIARAPLSKAGIAIIQSPALDSIETTTQDERSGEVRTMRSTVVVVTTLLAHSSGEWIRSSLTMRPTQSTPQGIGSAITYARRYALLAILGMTTDDDDDGAEASRVGPPRQGFSAPAGPVPRGTDALTVAMGRIASAASRAAVSEIVGAARGTMGDADYQALRQAGTERFRQLPAETQQGGPS